MSSVFISGSIALKIIPEPVKESIKKIIKNEFHILVGDAHGVDTMIQNYCKELNYFNVTVYTISSPPRYKIPGFRKKLIIPKSKSKKKRELQQEKDSSMTHDSEFSFIVWDGKSKGSYGNIIRAIDQNKKIKIYLGNKNNFIPSDEISKNNIEYIYRESNGYSASEVVAYLGSEGKEYFVNTQKFNKYLIDKNVIEKVNGIYKPMSPYENLFIIDSYRGKERDVKFTNEFISQLEVWMQGIKEPEVLSLF